ncbi:LIP-domain-containing protein [Xylariomycetidae sp. FL2044]|nr:LIP-domain-containing protein [Xylariomycetidae sp. FL2044]
MIFAAHFLFYCSVLSGLVTSRTLPLLAPDGRGSLLSRQASNESELLRPSDDPWYAAPVGWESESPGTVLKTRRSVYATPPVNFTADTLQVLYRTSDTHGDATWTVATVFVPLSPWCDRAADSATCSPAMVYFEVPYDSACPDASPGYLLQFGEPYGEMADMLRRGWYVAAPDYEGRLASYCLGKQAAHATLDALRAVPGATAAEFGLRFGDLRQAVWGYSGGAFAAQFTAEMAATYAPELEIAGIVVGGPAPNLTTVDERMTGKPTAGLVIASLLGITSQYPTAREFLLSHLKPTGDTYNASEFFRAKYLSSAMVLPYYEGQDVDRYFENGYADMFNPVIQEIIDTDSVLGLHGVPNMPMFIYAASADEFAPASETDALVRLLCTRGANILHHRNSIGTHNYEMFAGRKRALLYLSDVLDGTNYMKRPWEGCESIEVAITLTEALDGLHIIGQPEPEKGFWE